MSGPPSEHDRADRPRRRWLKVALLTLGVMVVVIGGVGGFVWWKTTPPPPVDAMPVLLQAREDLQPDGDHEDAWPRYVELFSTVLGMAHFNDFTATRLARVYRMEWETTWQLLHGDWNDPRLDEAKRLFAEQRPILDSLIHATDTPACRPPLAHTAAMGGWPSGDPITLGDAPPGTPREEVWMLHGVEFSGRLTTILLAAAREAFEAGNFERGLEMLERTLTLARHTAMSPLELPAMMGMTGEIRVLRETLHFAQENNLTPQQCESLQRVLTSGEVDTSLRARFETDGPLYANAEARRRSPPRVAISNSWKDWKSLVLDPGPRDVQRILNRRITRIAKEVDLPRKDRSALPGSLPPSMAAPMDLFETVMRARDHLVSLRAATRIVLLLEKHHALTGAWPDALEDIMPLDETLEPNTLEPFVYARTPEGPLPFTLRAPDAAAAFLRHETERDFTRPRTPIDNAMLGFTP